MDKPEIYKNEIQKDPYTQLRELSKARIALGNTGGSQSIKDVLQFQLDHAKARDAIYTEFNIEKIKSDLSNFGLDIFKFKSKAKDREHYLKRPDLGKLLAESEFKNVSGFDIIFNIVDGLSPEATLQSAKIIEILLPKLKEKYSAAISIVENGRVAIGDEIAEKLNGKFTATFIGERPGLSSPKSLGIYTTYDPKSGTTDEKRNCISNIHSDGMSTAAAAELLEFLINESFAKKISGVSLKSDLKNHKIDNA
ncbi:ethanolamine ammonia-lyase subunit EutC [Zunongwangia atlantica]|uniref:Ethanolamine ammonia-lyase small subunit n=1 Tax=Zunongwangia atlantica 22II14-10F7 TaxID=1185767 RepID=A0A1Y1T141_9FLAO|nr:ethanolamine ammonia-lyase subunit EutC [Zunongwangia atlantica]ORL44334.1 ethanolamine ammonia-lyase small subunit [Zunongwangia atlantica 22II14-10F7]